jgi:hypothetical protein
MFIGLRRPFCEISSLHRANISQQIYPVSAIIAILANIEPSSSNFTTNSDQVNSLGLLLLCMVNIHVLTFSKFFYPSFFSPWHLAGTRWCESKWILINIRVMIIVEISQLTFSNLPMYKKKHIVCNDNNHPFPRLDDAP